MTTPWRKRMRRDYRPVVRSTPRSGSVSAPTRHLSRGHGAEAVDVHLERHRLRGGGDGAAGLRGELRRPVDDGWTASFHGHAMLAADEIGTAPTAFEAVHVAAWRALGPPCVTTPGTTDVEIDVL